MKRNPPTKVPIDVTVVEMGTGKQTTRRSEATLMPAKPGTCQFCATAHDPNMAHNFQSLHYQMRFRMVHGVDATNEDAIAHLSYEAKAQWRAAYERVTKKHGLDRPWTMPTDRDPIAEVDHG